LIDSVRLQVAPVSRDILAEVKSVIKSIHRQVDRVEDGVETVHDMAVRGKEFQIEVQRRIEEPLLQLAAVMGSIKISMGGMARLFRR